MFRRHLIRTLIALVLLFAGRVLLVAAEGAAPVAQGANAPGMRAVVYGFFDDQTGERIGRLQIGKVDVEYQRHGFLRVAWDPLVVLDGVTLEVSAGAVWPQAGVKIIDALRVTGRQNASVLRRVRLRLAGTPAREITAATASLRRDGGLELVGVTLSGGAAPDSGAGNFCFWLAGPHAGQLIATAPAGATVAQTFSAKQTLAHPAP
jgi:hypothetical protein